LVHASDAAGAGIAARFGAMRAVEASPAVLRVQIDDDVGVVHRVIITARIPALSRTLTVEAKPTGAGGWWHGELAADEVPNAPAFIEVTAEVLGARGGLLLALGADEPYEVPVITSGRAKSDDAVFQRVKRAERPLPIVAFVGLEGRAGSNARARIVVGAAAHLVSPIELAIGLAVGPSFAEPADLANSGPFTLGFDIAVRGYTAPAVLGQLAPFAEVFGTADLRLPGFDAGGGVRAGIAYRLDELITIEGSVGGAAIAFGLTDPSSTFGFTGGARVLVRFGAAPE